ncbi:hypothetical protein [Nocardioides cavernaquae]|uniref:hypothetical protein n=1 Tax=Nocardioides cavernaquae TaxID=2321396 RepID=UPI0011C4691F|nr:hypothetical protein [Nocardioides cavernaquae]
MSTDVKQHDFVGRDVAAIVAWSMIAMGFLAGVAGLATFAGSGVSEHVFAWGFASPLGAALFGACLLGAVPLLASASLKPSWEQARIGFLPAILLVVGLAAVTVAHRDQLTFTGGIVAVFMALAWLAFTVALSGVLLVGLVAQLREPSFPLDRTAPIPRWSVPLVALLGAAYLGLGLGLLVEPSFWGPQLPFEVSVLDARALGVWALAIGATMLGALAEDDLDRASPGLIGVTAIGLLAVLAVMWRHGDVDWSAGIATLLFVVLIVALPATGLIGLALRKRAGAAGLTG